MCSYPKLLLDVQLFLLVNNFILIKASLYAEFTNNVYS
jgi:hypothetical protein